jgi:hypothetical protein
MHAFERRKADGDWLLAPSADTWIRRSTPASRHARATLRAPWTLMSLRLKFLRGVEVTQSQYVVINNVCSASQPHLVT